MTLVRLLRTSRKITEGSSSLAELTAEFIVNFINLATEQMLIASSLFPTLCVNKLATLDPVRRGGYWTCSGRPSKSLKHLLGKE